MKRTLTGLFALLVPVLGLFSCSSDRPQDTWALSEPFISDEGSPQLSISSASHQKHSPTAELVFREAETIGASLIAKTICQTKRGPVSGELRVQNPTRVQLRSLWPKRLWLELKNEELVQTSCSSEMIVTNAIGSTHRFQLSGVRLSSFVSDPLSPDFKLSEALVLADAPEESITSLTAMSKNSEAVLICENFRKSVSSGGALNSQGFAHSLFFGELQAASDLRTLSDPKKNLDPRVAKSVQKCRLVAFGANQMRMTGDFEVFFPAPKLRVTVTPTIRRFFADSQTRTAKLFTVEITNVDQVATAISLPNDAGLIQYRMLGQARAFRDYVRIQSYDFVLGHRTYESEFRLNVSGASRRWQIADRTVYEIEPGHTLQVIGEFDSNCFLLVIDPDHANVKNHIDLKTLADLGFFYDLTKEIDLRQYAYWDREVRDLKAATTRVSMLSLNPRDDSEDSRPANFAAFEIYYRLFDPEGREPQSEPLPLGPSGHGMDIQCFHSGSGFS